jgi:hypothetical protein
VSFGTDVVIQLTNSSERVQSHLGATKWGMWQPIGGSTALTNISLGAPTVSGTASSVGIASTNLMTRMPRMQYSTAAVANNVVGIIGTNATSAGLLYSTDTNDTGYELVCRFGFGTLPVNPRIYIGHGNVGLSTIEPSTLNNSIFFGKDSTDTNWQLMRRGTSATTKTDLGFAPALNVPYEITISKDPGNKDVKCMLFCLDGSQTPFITRIAAGSANLPTNNGNLIPAVQLALNATDTGTAALIYFMNLTLRTII